MDNKIAPPPKTTNDLAIFFEDSPELEQMRNASDKLTFDGYKLVWRKESSTSPYVGFSGLANESARESEKDLGPIPQGEFTIDPANIEIFDKDEAWGSHRVRIEPIKKTVDRMTTCFGLIRTGMYIHGGDKKGTVGCIELNDDSDEKAFFQKLKNYGKLIQLIVEYKGDRESKYEESKCPYP